MRGVLDSGGLRVVAYGVAALACVVAGAVELRRTPRGPELWPTFWFATAVVLAFMGLARAGDLGDVIADVGRREARQYGWYEIRRSYQAYAIGVVGAVWAVLVLVAVWRVPERRRRYLPAAIAVVTLVCFAALRMVSLHQVDGLLYRRDVAGVRVVAWAELGLLTLMLVAVAVPFLTPGRAVPAVPRHDRARFVE